MAGKRGNPYHDAKGLFSTAAGDADGHPGVSKASQDKNRAIKKAKQRQERQKVAPHLKKMSEESLRQLAKQQLASPHPSLAKPTVKALSQRFHTVSKKPPVKGTVALLGGHGVMVGDTANGVTTVTVGGRSLRVKTSDLKRVK